MFKSAHINVVCLSPPTISLFIACHVYGHAHTRVTYMGRGMPTGRQWKSLSIFIFKFTKYIYFFKSKKQKRRGTYATARHNREKKRTHRSAHTEWRPRSSPVLTLPSHTHPSSVHVYPTKKRRTVLRRVIRLFEVKVESPAAEQSTTSDLLTSKPKGGKKTANKKS